MAAIAAVAVSVAASAAVAAAAAAAEAVDNYSAGGYMPTDPETTSAPALHSPGGYFVPGDI